MTNDDLYAKEVSVLANAIAYAIETFGQKDPPDELTVPEERTEQYLAAAVRVLRQGAVIPALNPNYVTREQWKADCDVLLLGWMYGDPPGGSVLTHGVWSDPERITQFKAELADLHKRLRNTLND